MVKKRFNNDSSSILSVFNFNQKKTRKSETKWFINSLRDDDANACEKDETISQ